MTIFKKQFKRPGKKLFSTVAVLVLMPFAPALADFDGNSPKTYIIGTTPTEKEAIRIKQGKPPVIQNVQPSERIIVEKNPLVLDQGLEDSLESPNAADILKQLEN